MIGSSPKSGPVLATDPESLPEVELLSPSDDGDVTPVADPLDTAVDTGTVDAKVGSMNATSEVVPVEAAEFPDQAEFTAAPDVPEDHELVDDHVLAGAIHVFVVGVVFATGTISTAIGSMAKSSSEVVGATGATGTLMFGVGMLMFAFGTVTFGALTPMFGTLMLGVGMLMLGKLMSGTVMLRVLTPMFGTLMSGLGTLGNEASSDGRPRLNPPPHKIPNPHRIPNNMPKSPSNPHSTQQQGEQQDFLMVGSSSGARFL